MKSLKVRQTIGYLWGYKRKTLNLHSLFSNGVILLGISLEVSVLIYTFPISFSQHVWGVATSQSGKSSGHVERIAIDSLTKTNISFMSMSSNMVDHGAYCIVLGN